MVFVSAGLELLVLYIFASFFLGFLGLRGLVEACLYVLLFYGLLR